MIITTISTGESADFFHQLYVSSQFRNSDWTRCTSSACGFSNRRIYPLFAGNDHWKAPSVKGKHDAQINLQMRVNAFTGLRSWCQGKNRINIDMFASSHAGCEWQNAKTSLSRPNKPISGKNEKNPGGDEPPHPLIFAGLMLGNKQNIFSQRGGSSMIYYGTK